MLIKKLFLIIINIKLSYYLWIKYTYCIRIIIFKSLPLLSRSYYHEIMELLVNFCTNYILYAIFCKLMTKIQILENPSLLFSCTYLSKCMSSDVYLVSLNFLHMFPNTNFKKMHEFLLSITSAFLFRLFNF